MKFIIFLILCVTTFTAFAETDYCDLASESLYADPSNLISVIKINTTRTALYSSTVETSQDCQNYNLLFSVKNPDVIKTKHGLCAVLPAEEIKPGLCSLNIKVCVSETECQDVIIRLTSENNHYTKADPAIYEMDFN
ncbi:Uncharacterised protein [Legionella wadsworthii]|uniref:Secreted protein n=1 Tax=Legionella wadsworthii TaxID=28088 RepID=A0A378LMR6_9GAMM|nr:hypothetical protein [Legionella wadsworthii]STY28206.1 Uncharacterised protein [Legionella wadsworthii]